MKKISLGSWAFSFGPHADHPVPLDAIARRAAEAGYDGLELCGFPPHASLDVYGTTERRKELRKRLDDLGLATSGYSADLTAANPTADGNRTRYLELIRQNLEFAVDLGSPVIRLDTVAAPGSLPDEDYAGAFRRLGETWHETAELASKAGVRVVWEFEPGFVFNKPSEIVELHEEVRHSNFYVLFDTAHAYTCAAVGARQHGEPEILRGGVEGMLDLCAGRIGAVHLVDTDGSLYNDETSTHLPLGSGVIDFERLALKLNATRSADWWTIDLSFCPDAWDQIQPSLAFARKIAK